ncbi:AfsR/SARP family transcriptional regulator [Kitasatospora kifunensis]|uniref:DNA-binding SARP family transcriptional activator/tetratricopeptide (TPR) repeat protein n=1 Tax=Kitasatospora kifunensis TaxID=58351 RepID=A0A7W7R8Y9_KITKI|nr:AfsR/SARP family transcriptional regulator [Kitasatospora kifunensis]MBB4927011.1 DNA-binding SARP family transcriptional activator/tetratricopeptide (TPR) repeat protein [Kitasatospora kifunensis]
MNERPDPVRFNLLGPVNVTLPDGKVVLPSGGPRAVLVMLLVNANRVVSVEQLASAVWGEDRPSTACASLRNHVLRLRRMLGDNTGLRLRTVAPGYLITTNPGELDVEVFLEGCRLGAEQLRAGEVVTARQTLSTALDLWRGEPFADLPPCVDGAARAHQLDETRMKAWQDRVDADLRLGRHRELVAELRGLTQAHPLREALHGQLMLALYRADRQAEALAVYQDLRRRLVAELGVEPSVQVADLQLRILAADPSLLESVQRSENGETAPGRAAGTGQSGNGPGSGASTTDPARNAPAGYTPRNSLPRDVADFTGRGPETDRLLAAAAAPATSAVVISAIDGMAGVGKTALAVHVAHALADQYADGQVFIDLHGFTPGQTPLEPGTALARLLRAVGVSEDVLPSDPEERALLWRSVAAEHRLLIVLDNAVDAAQVRPLLPGSPGSLVLVTSRRRMPALAGAGALSLDVLGPDTALALFGQICGPDRIVGEEDAVAEIVRLCGYLPLAIRITAARLAHRGAWTPSHLLARLRERISLPTELRTQDQSVAAAFAVSYDALAPDQQRIFRLAGLHPGDDFSAYALAALADLPLTETEDLVEELHDHHLLIERSLGRYTFHDLLRQHAHGLARAEESDATRQAALERLFDYYSHTAAAAADILYPHESHRRPHPPKPATPTDPLRGEESARIWLDTELTNLITAGTHPVAAANRHSSDLSGILARYLDHYGHYSRSLTLHTAAAEATTATGDLAGHATAQTNLAGSYWLLGRYPDAIDCFQASLLVFRNIGDQAGERRVLTNLGATYAQLSRHQEAIDHFTWAMAAYEAAGDRAGQVIVLNNLGATCERTKDFEQAARYHRQAIALAREVGDHVTEGRALANLGMTLHHLDQPAEAAQVLHQALAMATNAGDRTRQLFALNGLGDIERATDPAQALARHQQAREICASIGDRFSLAGCHLRIGDDYQAMGDPGMAQEQWEQSAAVYTELKATSQLETVRARLDGA